MNVPCIGAKRGGMREQCSQKIFGLAEIFEKINKLWIYMKYSVEEFLYEATISQNFSIFKIFSDIFGVFIDLKTVEN